MNKKIKEKFNMNNKNEGLYKSFDEKSVAPGQLQNKEFEFCKIERGGIKPFERGWVKKGYQWNDPDFQNWVQSGGNYGVLGGHGDLVILDCFDLPRLKELGIIDALPLTFTVETPDKHGWHLYYKCKGITKRAAFYDPERTEIATNGKSQYMHVADLVSFGCQAVGPNSLRIFPNDEEKVRSYKVISDLLIAEINQEQLQEAIKILRTTSRNKDKSIVAYVSWVNSTRAEDFSIPDNIVWEGIKLQSGGYPLTDVVKYDKDVITLDANVVRESVYDGIFISNDIINESSEGLIGKPVHLYKSHGFLSSPLNRFNEMIVIGEIRGIKPNDSEILKITADIWPNKIPRDVLSYLHPESGWEPLSRGIANVTVHPKKGTYNGRKYLGPQGYEWKAMKLKWESLVLEFPGVEVIGRSKKKNKTSNPSG